MHLVNQFLVLRYDKQISDSQHGFRPGRGTLTAWLRTLELIPKYKYVYEFDYVKFFDSLNQGTMHKAMKGLFDYQIRAVHRLWLKRKDPRGRGPNASETFFDRLMQINNRLPNLPEVQLLPEHKLEYKDIQKFLKDRDQALGLDGKAPSQSTVKVSALLWTS